MRYLKIDEGLSVTQSDVLTEDDKIMIEENVLFVYEKVTGDFCEVQSTGQTMVVPEE
jgi:hypothetical protein